jgi:hypothetical protein
MADSNTNEILKEVYFKTDIRRKPISGIVSGYHELPYILVAPHSENPSHTVEINGKINVSPKFIISPTAINESFGDVFDPETFNDQIEGRLFSFVYGGKKNVKVESEFFRLQNFEENPEEHINRVHDSLLQQEDTRTGLIFGPVFSYYPVSIDKYISEILDREFRL